jgi:hypothetical protein
MKENIFGNDYSTKMEIFQSRLDGIYSSYSGDFDTNNPYYTMIPNDGKISLIFDTDKNIPQELMDEINKLFLSIFS